MRDIKYIILHCTATSQDTKVENIIKYWKERLGWKNPGYHFIIDVYGNVTQLQPISKPSNGVKGYNSNSINISYIGGKDIDDRSLMQVIAQESIVKTLHAIYPDAKILGHRDFPNVAKSCPRFDVKEWVNSIKL
jgi:N-acetylmuramoyl-L-alanine amidase